MLTEKETRAAIDTAGVTWNLIEDEVTDKETGLVNDGFGDFFKTALFDQLGDTLADVKMSKTRKREIKREMNALFKSLMAQINRVIDEEL
jgi:CRISPR/Cas system Type II protein with McrA/HNH and RuvC-like nuclease domain